MGQVVIRDHSAVQFLDKAGELLYREEAVNSLMIGLSTSLLQAQAAIPPKLLPVFLRVEEAGSTVTAALQTPPYNLIVSHATSDQLEALAKFLRQERIDPPGVVGPAGEVEQFAKVWSKLTGQGYHLAMRQKLYKLETVIHPNTAGRMLVAGPEHTNLITQWFVEFALEATPVEEHKSFAEFKPQVEAAIAQQQPHLWLVGEEIVAMALTGRPTRDGVSIRGVYTPPRHRKRGYASVLVAALSQKMLDSGKKFCVLYTDRAFPTSNKIYQEVGYREVADSNYFIFR